MPREDNLSSRFDYLFEPLDVEESVDDSETAGGRWNGASDKDETPGNGAPVRMAFAALVQNQTQDPVNSPAEPSPVPTTVTEVPSQVAAVAPPPRVPRGGVQNSPSTRAPFSVTPESRPAFPNQGPRTGANGGGGLLGGLL